PPQRLHRLAGSSLALLEVGEQVEKLRIVWERAESLHQHRLPLREVACSAVGDRQADPVGSVRRRVYGLPVVVDRLGMAPGLIGVPAEARVARAQRAPDVIPPTARRQLTVSLARRRDIALLVESVRLPRRTGGGIVADGPGHGLYGALQAERRQGGQCGRRRIPSGSRGHPTLLPPVHHGWARHAE